jgi:glycosyltransferase involved in cell wall biosynthesis
MTNGSANGTGRVAHLVRRYGELSQTFIADAVIEAERQGWEGWVVTKYPRANEAAFPYPAGDRVLEPVRPSAPRRVLGRIAGRSQRERTAGWFAPPLREAGPDVLHVHFGWMGAEIALSRLSTPVVVSFHGSDVTSWPSRDPANRAQYDAMFPELTRATVTSRFIEKRLRALGYEGPLDLLPAGVRMADFPYREPRPIDTEIRLLFVGRQVACKGLDVLLRALPLIEAAVPVRLDVIGAGEDAQDNERLARELGVERSVRFLGGRPRSDVVEHMRAADIVVIPSRVTPAGEAEGSPVAPKEALAIGVPVVATDVGGLPEVIPPEYRHEIVAPDDPAALATGIGRLIGESATWPERARIGRRFVEQEFDWEQLGRRTARIYADAVAGRR